MSHPQLNSQTIDAPPLVHKPAKVRPARWSWRLEGLEMSRADLVKSWQLMRDAAHLVPGEVYFHEGKGCTTSPKYGGREGRKVRTLRELLIVARVDYVAPVVKP